MSTGTLLTYWTARLALVLYAAGLGLRLMAGGSRDAVSVARLAWTAGCLIFLIHVACAFHFVHHWSHAAAYAATARQTTEVTGFNWGGGLYANYAFTLVWLMDAIDWWRGLERYERRARWIEWTIQTFLAFMAFNATVVFGHGLVRWIGAAASVVLIAFAMLHWRASARSTNPSNS